MDKSLDGLLPALLATNKNITESDKLHTQQHIQLMELIRKTMMTSEWSALLLNLNDRLNTHDSMDDTLKVLIETLGSLHEHIGGLTTIVNTSVDRDISQQQAIQAMTNTIIDSNRQQQQAMERLTQSIEHMANAFVENTARLDTLTLAIQDVTKDDALDNIYQKLTDVTNDR